MAVDTIKWSDDFNRYWLNDHEELFLKTWMHMARGYEKEYVIIGDSLKNDIAFANHAGIRSIWFNPKCKKNKSQYKPTMQVTSLYEVCQRIKQ